MITKDQAKKKQLKISTGNVVNKRPSFTKEASKALTKASEMIISLGGNLKLEKTDWSLEKHDLLLRNRSQMTAFVGGVFRKLPIVPGTTMNFTGEIYQGKRDGSILKFIIPGERDGSYEPIVYEVPLMKLQTYFVLDDWRRLVDAILVELNELKAVSDAQYERKQSKLKQDKRWGAWA